MSLCNSVRVPVFILGLIGCATSPLNRTVQAISSSPTASSSGVELEEAVPHLESVILAGHPSDQFWTTLKNYHLIPKHWIRFSNASYWFSDPYMMKDRPAVIGIVKVDHSEHLRIFYRSHSQNIWRV